MNLFQTGHFQLHSGEQSTVKIECDALTPDDWQTLAGLIAERVGRFRSVYGIPTGGDILEELLAPQSTGDWRDPVLICDDVYTTGASMRHAHVWMQDTENIVGVVVFARRPVQEEWITALFTMSEAR